MFPTLMNAIPFACVGIGLIASKYINGDIDPEVKLKQAQTENLKTRVREEELKFASKEAIIRVVEKEDSNCKCFQAGVEVK